MTKARAALSRGRDCWVWTVPECPFCGAQHEHGGGPLDGDPRQFLGHRVAHCTDRQPVGDYELEESSDARAV